MATAQNIIDSAARKIGMPSPDASDSAIYLEVLNEILSLWGGENIIIPYFTKETYSIGVGVNEITIGSGGDINTTHPLLIHSLFLRDSDNFDYPIHEMNLEQFNAIQDKSKSARPKHFYFEPVYPLGKIYLSSKTVDAETLHINSKKRLTQIALLGDSFTLPDEYKVALIYNLSVFAAPSFAIEATSIVTGIAAKSIKVLRDKALLVNMPRGKVDSALLYRSNNRYGYNVNEN
ncbi:MAG: hypothetical protein BMS9Abin31_0703 [Gammaproteobacteria bacterium]|nr:MAG: hypothetical protein BMS9Abin31_0703 [Gammaproteobacteria bacterium]